MPQRACRRGTGPAPGHLRDAAGRSAEVEACGTLLHPSASRRGCGWSRSVGVESQFRDRKIPPPSFLASRNSSLSVPPPCFVFIRQRHETDLITRFPRSDGRLYLKPAPCGPGGTESARTSALSIHAALFTFRSGALPPNLQTSTSASLN